MASKKAHVISVYINRNITSKLIGRNSPTRPHPVQKCGLAQCLAIGIMQQILVTQIKGYHAFQIDLETKMVRDLETVCRRES